MGLADFLRSTLPARITLEPVRLFIFPKILSILKFEGYSVPEGACSNYFPTNVLVHEMFCSSTTIPVPNQGPFCPRGYESPETGWIYNTAHCENCKTLIKFINGLLDFATCFAEQTPEKDLLVDIPWCDLLVQAVECYAREQGGPYIPERVTGIPGLAALCTVPLLGACPPIKSSVYASVA